MTNHKSLLTIGAVLVAALFVATASKAGGGTSSVNKLTMNRSTSLAGVVLAPGAYTFEVLEGHTDIVRVTSTGQNRVMYTGFTTVVERPAGLPPTSALRFGESQRGEPVPIVAWFPLGSSTGHEFRRR